MNDDRPVKPQLRQHATTRLAQWRLTPLTGPFTREMVPGSLSHDEGGFLWVTYPDRSVRAFDGEAPQSGTWPPREDMPWPVVHLRRNLTPETCEQLTRQILAEESLASFVHGSKAGNLAELAELGITLDRSTLCGGAELNKLVRQGPVLAHDHSGDLCYFWADGGETRGQWLELSISIERDPSNQWTSAGNSASEVYVIASRLTRSQDAAVWKARGRRARVEATRETLMSSAERFAAAVCELAQTNVITPDDVLAWIDRSSDPSKAWLHKCTSTHVAWGGLQLKRSGPSNPDVNMQILQRLTAHARDVLDILRINEWTPAARSLASMWIGDTSPWTTGSLLDASGRPHTRNFGLFRQPPVSLSRWLGDHGTTNLWWDSGDIASILRSTRADGSELLPRFVGERSWRSDTPTVVGRVNVPEQVARDPGALARVRRLWRMRATSACRHLGVAAYIPSYIPEVIEVFS